MITGKLEVILFLIISPIVAFMLVKSICQKPLYEGTVYNKSYYQQEIEEDLVILPSTYGAILMPVTYYYPNRWAIDIVKETEDKQVIQRWWVDQETYKQTKIGDSFIANENSRTKEPRSRN